MGPNSAQQTLDAREHDGAAHFRGTTEAILPVPCSYDLNIAATKYFYVLEEGEVPLLFLFSGTIFYAGADGRLQVQQISWNNECSLPNAGAALEGIDGGPLSRHAAGSTSIARFSSGFALTNAAADSRIGKRRSKNYCARNKSNEPRARRQGGQRGSLRGLHPLSVSAFVEKESGGASLSVGFIRRLTASRRMGASLA